MEITSAQRCFLWSGCAEQTGFALWLCSVALDEECIHGEMLNSAVELGLATALLSVLENVPGKVFFWRGINFLVPL